MFAGVNGLATAGPRRRTATLSVVLALLAAASGTATAAETLSLDTHADSGLPAVETSAALVAGHVYAVTVQGTYSNVRARRWGFPSVCGTPLAAPLLPSPGVENGPVGFDAETLWARTSNVPCAGPYPRHHKRFEIDLGAGFAHVEPTGGPLAVPSADHAYAYSLTGTGVPAAFRLRDEPAADNYGVLRITVTDTTAAPDGRRHHRRRRHCPRPWRWHRHACVARHAPHRHHR